MRRLPPAPLAAALPSVRAYRQRAVLAASHLCLQHTNIMSNPMEQYRSSVQLIVAHGLCVRSADAAHRGRSGPEVVRHAEAAGMAVRGTRVMRRLADSPGKP